MSRVTLAESAGFCFGVKRAIEMAYAEIEKNNGEPLYSYGPLIHNKEVTNDLDRKGLHIIESLDGIDKGTVVIRSHGVGKFLYDALEEVKLLLFATFNCLACISRKKGHDLGHILYLRIGRGSIPCLFIYSVYYTQNLLAFQGFLEFFKPFYGMPKKRTVNLALKNVSLCLKFF